MVKSCLGSLSGQSICLGLAPPTGTCAHLQSGDETVPASWGPDQSGAARVMPLGQCRPCLPPQWPGQGRATRSIRGPGGPLRGAKGLGPTYQPPPTQADVPSNVAAGLSSLGIAEKLVRGGWRQDRVPDDRGLGSPSKSTSGPVTAPGQDQPLSLA